MAIDEGPDPPRGPWSVLLRCRRSWGASILTTARTSGDERGVAVGQQASVPFDFDVHAISFSDDAVGIETAMHQHFADRRVNEVNMGREFFCATPAQALRTPPDP